MKKLHRICSIALSLLLLLSAAGCGQSKKSALDPKNPVTIDLWHYYNGDQQAVFDQLVSEFNETAGKEQGIVVESVAQGSVADLEAKVLASIEGQVGASELPDIFAAYTTTAYSADTQGLVVDLRGYLTEEEIDSYVEGYIKEGDFSGSGEIKIFPIAKSTEILALNQTDWDIFAAATGAAIEDLSTLEGLTETAQRYYEWTDAQTPDVSGDGRAFFGRDSMANYLLIAGMQLGVEIFSAKDSKLVLNFDEAALRQLWDYYYIPFVKGYFASKGHFRSDDLKTGAILCYAGSSAGAPYFPNEIIISDTESYPVEISVLPAPQFKDGAAYAVQQGAGMVVTKGTEAEVQASVEFLKWFTDAERNVQFAVQSGYLPVKKAANEAGVIFNSGYEPMENVKKSLTAAIDTVNHSYMYTAPAFENGTDARNTLEACLSNQAVADRLVVEERLLSGMSLEEASEEFCTDAHFQAWYAATLAALQKWESS